MYASLFFHFRHKELRVLYEVYDCCTIVTIALVLGIYIQKEWLNNNIHRCVIKIDALDIFSVSLHYIKLT